MSYILDALKKSDQERKQGHVPDLQTVHIPAAVESSATPWPYILIVVLMLSLAFVLGSVRPWESSSVTSSTSLPDIQLKSAGRASEDVLEKKESHSAPVLMAEADVQPKREINQLQHNKPLLNETIENTPPPTLDMDSVPHLYEIDASLRSTIPEMSFAGHVFSSAVEQRSVIINGQSMSEGDDVFEGLKVEQITQNGIVFDYNGELFRMDILQDWSFD